MRPRDFFFFLLLSSLRQKGTGRAEMQEEERTPQHILCLSGRAETFIWLSHVLRSALENSTGSPCILTYNE